jgi:ketosteroid isomerase-like protein
MKSRTPLILVGLLMLALVPSAGAQASSNSASDKAAEQALQRRTDEYDDALTKRDIAKLEKIWSSDYTFINPQGELLTKAQRIANVTSGATGFKAINLQRERLEIMGEVAIDIGRVTLQGTQYSGKESSGDYRYMDVWRKTGGEWQLVANQLTLIK